MRTRRVNILHRRIKCSFRLSYDLLDILLAAMRWNVQNYSLIDSTSYSFALWSTIFQSVAKLFQVLCSVSAEEMMVGIEYAVIYIENSIIDHLTI